MVTSTELAFEPAGSITLGSTNLNHDMHCKLYYFVAVNSDCTKALQVRAKQINNFVGLFCFNYPVQKYINMEKSLISITPSLLQSIVAGGFSFPNQKSKIEKSIKFTRLSLL